MKSDDGGEGAGRVLIEMESVSKCFHPAGRGGAVEALAPVNLRILEREFLAVIGPSGCGKSTLLNLLAGLESPTTGHVKKAERLAGETIPLVFQHYTLFPWRTIVNNVAFSLQMHGMARRERHERAMHLLGEFGLEDFADALPHELSGGMRQRAAIAQALANRPAMILMDEPFGALDDLIRMDLQATLAAIHARTDLTVVFVTHNIDEAIVLADRILVFSPRPGRVLDEIRVTMPRPRQRSDPSFPELFRRIRGDYSNGA